MNLKLKDLFSVSGSIDRDAYFIWGCLLFALKFNINKYLLIYWDKPLDSFFIIPGFDLLAGTSQGPALYQLERSQAMILAFASFPFLWCGIILTIKRLRSINIPSRYGLLFFVPFVNYLFFLILSIVPARAEPGDDPQPLTYAQRIIPKDPWGASVMAIGMTVALGLVSVLIATNLFRNYGGGLFLGIPFIVGFLAVMLSSVHYVISFKQSIGIAATVTMCLVTMLLLLGIEGVICIMMAAPLAFPLAMMGASLAYLLQRERRIPRNDTLLVTALPLLLAGLMAQEAQLPAGETLIEASTAIEIDAPPERVWQNVIAFPELPPPSSWLFYSGVAYPVGAHIDREGVGAVRHCRFSTGAFEEPITVWDPPKLLKFSVTSSPPPLREWSIYRHIHPPHLDNFFESHEGQFLLTPLEGNRTRIVGTTWYTHRIGPSWYWKIFSNYIVHAIHTRVLEHIKHQSEM